MITPYSAFTKTQAESHASQKREPEAPRSFQKGLVLLEHSCAMEKIHLTLFYPHQLSAGSADDLVVYYNVAEWGKGAYLCDSERKGVRGTGFLDC